MHVWVRPRPHTHTSATLHTSGVIGQSHYIWMSAQGVMSSKKATNNPGLCPINPLKAKLNPICRLLALLGAHHILHVSRIRVKGQQSGLCSQAMLMTCGFHNYRHFASLKVFTQVQSVFLVFCDMRLCHWVSGWCFVHHRFKVHQEMDLEILKMMTTCSLEVPGTTYAVRQKTRVNSLLNSWIFEADISLPMLRSLRFYVIIYLSLPCLIFAKQFP
jgi:hypothetical protein